MGKFFRLIVIFILTSCASVKRESYEVKELPEARFLFEEVQQKVSDKKEIEKIKRQKTALINYTSSLFNVTKDSSSFIRIDLKRSYLLDVGLFIKDPGGRIAANKTKTRPAGKYLIMTYKVPHSYRGKLFGDVPATIREAKVTPVDLIFYIFSTPSSDAETYQLYLHVK